MEVPTNYVWMNQRVKGDQAGAGSPVSTRTPDYLGQKYFDTTNSDWYVSTGLANTSWSVDTAQTATDLGVQGNFLAQGPTSSATIALISAVPVDRVVIILAEAQDTFADIGGNQPTFELGQTGNANKFAATSKFTNAAANTVFMIGGVLSANTEFLITEVAGTGTSTGVLAVTVIAAPSV